MIYGEGFVLKLLFMPYVVFCFYVVVSLSACSTTSPTKAIADSAIKDLHNITDTLDRIEKQTSEECKTDALMSNIAALRSQSVSISSQIKSIELAHKTEKQVLEEKITVREVVIASLSVILLLIIYLRIRKKFIAK